MGTDRGQPWSIDRGPALQAAYRRASNKPAARPAGQRSAARRAMSDGDRFGHVLDMLGRCNAAGPVTIAGMGPSSLVVYVTVGTGRMALVSTGPTLTVALERMVRRLSRA